VVVYKTHCGSQVCLLFGQKEYHKVCTIAGAALLITPFSVLKVPGKGIKGGADFLVAPVWLHWL
jgi:hypothetical protein